jgi:hypothetical protein
MARLRSNIAYGITEYSIPASLAFSTTQSTRQQTAYVNLIWSPIWSTDINPRAESGPLVNIGLAFMWGERLERKSPAGTAADNTARRIQASFQYYF